MVCDCGDTVVLFAGPVYWCPVCGGLRNALPEAASVPVADECEADEPIIIGE